MISRNEAGEKCLILYPGKVLDNSNAHEMSEEIIKGQSEGHSYIVVNLTALEFISSAGVGSILGSVGSLREAGGDIILCNVSDNIRHVLEILDLCDYLTIVPDESAAVRLSPVGGNR